MQTTQSSIRLNSIARSSLAAVMVLGISLFFFLYVLAALYYPGGSNTDVTASGFDIYTNYWCDLLGSHAKNGHTNPAQPIALTAMVLLCLTLAYFWYVTPPLFGFSKTTQRFLQTAGILSMAVAPFIFTASHDTIINVAGILGVVAMFGTFVGLYKSRALSLFGFGISCLVLCSINNYVYYTRHFIEHLPIIQKITFLVFLLWFGLVSLTLRRNSIAT